MVDIGSTIRLNGAYKSKPSVPGNGQIGTATNYITFFGTNISNHFLSGDTIPTKASTGLTYKLNGLVNLPMPVKEYYYLAANLTIGNVREYWTDITPSLVNAPSGAVAYNSSSLTVLGTFQVIGSISIPTITSTYPSIGNAAAQFYVGINGTNFVEGATVTFNGLSATGVTIISSRLIYCLAPIITTYGTVDIVVTNPNGKTSGTTGNAILTCPVDPVVSSITPATGPTGTSITDLGGSGFFTGATVSFSGVAATNVVVVSPTQITCTVPGGLTIGANDILVTNTTGQTSGTSGNGLFTGTFSPAALNLTNWQNGDYVTLPWAGTASAGTSGTVNEITWGTAADPTVGLALNGHDSAHYANAKISKLSETSIDNLITTTSYTVSALIYIVSAPAASLTTAYQHGMIFCSSQYFGVTYSTAGITVFHYTGAFPAVTVPCSTGAWHLVDVRYDGTNVSIRIDGGAWTSGAVGNIIFGGDPQTGRDYPSYPPSGTADFYLMERIVSKLQISDTDLDNYRGYINTRYGTSF
jgi:hypothetical protein